MKELEFREIKFRAFDTENKTWTFVTLGDLICGACTEKGDKPLSGAKQVWEQYTGLKDKNGKEIYEGDILVSNYGTVYKVSYSECNGRFEMWSEDGSGGSIADDQYTEDFKIEVIGNIHENPELLEQGNAKN